MWIDYAKTAAKDVWQQPIALSKEWYPAMAAAALAETLIYGMHFVLFVMASSILVKKGGRTQIASFCAMTIMFALATADVGFSYHLYLYRMDEILAGDTRDFLTMVYPKFLIHLINNLIADILLTMRCYIIWGESKVLAYTAGFILFVGTALGFIGEGTTSPKLKVLVGPYIGIVVLLNVILTLLAAWKIWWIAREVRRAMGRRVHRGFSMAVGIFLESGFIYSVSTMLVLMLSRSKFVVVGVSISIRMVCIMPIFIVVQVALGRGTKDLNASISGARSGDGGVQFTTAVHLQTTVAQEVTVEGRNVD